MSKKVYNRKVESSIPQHEFEEKFPKILTRRLISSQIASIFDFLGLLTPFTLRGKLLMRELVKEQQLIKEVSIKDLWDISVSPLMYEKWKDFFLTCLKFRVYRSTDV